MIKHITIHRFQIDRNAPCLTPKILRNHVFQFLLSITVVPRKIEDNCYAIFFLGGGEEGGGRELNKVHYGVGENGQFRDMKKDLFFAATKRLGADSLWHCCGVHGSLTSVTLLSSG